jgi:hypothetical protein
LKRWQQYSSYQNRSSEFLTDTSTWLRITL